MQEDGTQRAPLPSDERAQAKLHANPRRIRSVDSERWFCREPEGVREVDWEPRELRPDEAMKACRRDGGRPYRGRVRRQGSVFQVDWSNRGKSARDGRNRD